jgi:hypothetical protein
MSQPQDQSDEHILWRPVLFLSFGALVLFAAASVSAILLEHEELGHYGDDPTISRADVAAVQIGMVERRIIANEDRALRLNAQRKAQLDEYGWVDRQNGVIRIPVERAMELVVEGQP